MQTIFCCYDIPDSLKVSNPSAIFRRYGFRVNLSCWVFPQHLLPTDGIDKLRAAGATVHLIEFAEKDQDKILDLARAELQRHARKMVQFVSERVERIKDDLGTIDFLDKHESLYKKWRGVISKGKRELLAAEQCAFGFQINREVDEALGALKALLRAELDLALSWRDAHKQKGCLDGAAALQPAEAV